MEPFSRMVIPRQLSVAERGSRTRRVGMNCSVNPPGLAWRNEDSAKAPTWPLARQPRVTSTWHLS